jgi:hypothetical protein
MLWLRHGAADDVMALLCWPEQMVAALEKQIDTLPTRADAMPAAERVRRVGELEATLLELERHEESLILKAQGDGIEVLRRVDAASGVVRPGRQGGQDRCSGVTGIPVVNEFSSRPLFDAYRC